MIGDRGRGHLGSSLQDTHRLMVVLICDPSAWEAMTQDPKFEARLGYRVEPCLENNEARESTVCRAKQAGSEPGPTKEAVFAYRTMRGFKVRIG